MSMSLDTFVTGPNVSTELPVGEGTGTSVHDWKFSGKSDAEAERFDRDQVAETAERGGADVEGHVRRLDVARWFHH
jgi:hypothetical protein